MIPLRNEIAIIRKTIINACSSWEDIHKMNFKLVEFDQSRNNERGGK